MKVNLLARVWPRPSGALLVAMLDGLKAEREVVRLRRSLDVQTGIARAAHERIDRLSAGLSAEVREHQATRRLLEERQNQLLALRVADDLATERIRFLEGERRPLELRCEGLTEIADALRDELRALRRRKGRR